MNIFEKAEAMLNFIDYSDWTYCTECGCDREEGHAPECAIGLVLEPRWGDAAWADWPCWKCNRKYPQKRSSCPECGENRDY